MYNFMCKTAVLQFLIPIAHYIANLVNCRFLHDFNNVVHNIACEIMLFQKRIALCLQMIDYNSQVQTRLKTL